MVGAFTNLSDDRRRAPAKRKIALHRYRSGRHAIDRIYQKQCGTLLLNNLLVLRVACRGYVLRQLLIDADSALWRELRDPRITGTCQGIDSCCGGTSAPGARAAVGRLRRSLL